MFLLYFQHSNKWDSGLVQLLCKIYWLNTIPKHAAFLWTISSWLASRFKDLQLLSKLEIVKWEGRQQWPMKTLLELPLVPIIEFSLFSVKIFVPGTKPLRLENFYLFGYGPSLDYRNICLSFVTKKKFWCIYILFSSIYCIKKNKYVIYYWSTFMSIFCIGTKKSRQGRNHECQVHSWSVSLYLLHSIKRNLRKSAYLNTVVHLVLVST